MPCLSALLNSQPFFLHSCTYPTLLCTASHTPHRCSKGTYIRSLVYDIGRALGSVAFMATLRREAIGDFHVRDAWPLQELVEHLHTVRKQHEVVQP